MSSRCRSRDPEKETKKEGGVLAQSMLSRRARRQESVRNARRSRSGYGIWRHSRPERWYRRARGTREHEARHRKVGAGFEETIQRID